MNDIIAIVSLVLILGLAALCFVLWRKQQGALQELTVSNQRLSALEQDIKALYAGAAGVGTHLARIEKRLYNLSDRQEKLDEHDVVGQHYNQAIELIREGAGVDEVMQRCGLMQEEAELLQRLHGVNN